MKNPILMLVIWLPMVVIGRKYSCHGIDTTPCYSRPADKSCWACRNDLCQTMPTGTPCDDLDASTTGDFCTVTGTCMGLIRGCTPCGSDSTCNLVTNENTPCMTTKCVMMANTYQRCCVPIVTPGATCTMRDTNTKGICTVYGGCVMRGKVNSTVVRVPQCTTDGECTEKIGSLGNCRAAVCRDGGCMAVVAVTDQSGSPLACQLTPSASGVCHSSGVCVGCITSANCVASDPCVSTDCNIATNRCVNVPVPSGTVCAMSTLGKTTRYGVCNSATKCVECITTCTGQLPTCGKQQVCMSEQCVVEYAALADHIMCPTGMCVGSNGTCAADVCLRSEDCTVTASVPLDATSCRVYECVNGRCIPQYATPGATCAPHKACNHANVCAPTCVVTEECPNHAKLPVTITNTVASILLLTSPNTTQTIVSSLVPAIGITATWTFQPDNMFHGDVVSTTVLPRTQLRLPVILDVFFGNISCSLSRIIARSNLTGMIHGSYGSITGSVCGDFDVLCPIAMQQTVCLVFNTTGIPSNGRTENITTIGTVCQSEWTCGSPHRCEDGCSNTIHPSIYKCDPIIGICVG